MALSLQEQLLKAGLADKKKSQQIKQEKRKKDKIKRTQKRVDVDETKLSVEQQIEEKKARDRALNQKAKEEAERKAIAYQILQIIQLNKIDIKNGDISFNFTHDNIIKRVHVDARTQQALHDGKLAIVSYQDGYEIIPMPAAEKIAQRDADTVVYVSDNDAQQNASTSDEDDWYADFKVPDDLMW